MRIRNKADLLKLIASLPDDLDIATCVDLGDIIKWMASPERVYHQSGSSAEGTIAGVHPAGYPKKHRYFLVFEPEPYA